MELLGCTVRACPSFVCCWWLLAVCVLDEDTKTTTKDTLADFSAFRREGGTRLGVSVAIRTDAQQAADLLVDAKYSGMDST